MKKFIRILLISFLFLTVASFATCYFGVEHEINKIPVEVRLKMSDFDWIGVEWITPGILIQTIAFSCLLLAIFLYFFYLPKNKQSRRI